MHAIARKALVTFAAAWLLLPPLNVWAAVRQQESAKPKKKVATSTVMVTGPAVPCKRWGPLQIRLKVAKTVTTIGTKRTVKIKILAIDFPIISDKTFKSKYINEQALPLLVEQTLETQDANVETISGATDTTVSYKNTLNAALLLAKK